MWYKFTAYNSQTLYGWTLDQAVLDAVLDQLNSRREVNVYAATELGDTDDVTDDQGHKLSDIGHWICDDDTTVDDVMADNS